MSNTVLDDMRYSGLVGIIQNQKEVGRNILIEIAKARENNIKRKHQLEYELAMVNTSIIDFEGGVEHILKHLKLKKPLYINNGGSIVVISDKNIVINNNIL